MDLHLNDKIVIVTGGGAGIGGAISLQLAREGAVPVILGRSPLKPAFVETLTALCPRFGFFQLELEDEPACADAVARTIAQFGAIDALVNNAGVNDSVGLEAGRAAFVRSLEANLIHYYVMAHLCVEQIKARRGSIVNISSFQGTNASPFMTPYGAAKAGVIQLSKSMALELAPHGIRVNVVAPAFILTPAAEREMSPERKAASVAAIPLARAGHPSDIAGIVLSLASNLAAFTTGQVIVVDGGLGLTNARPHRGQIG